MCSEFLVVDYDPPLEPNAESDARRDAEEAAILLAESPAPVDDHIENGDSSGVVADGNDKGEGDGSSVASTGVAPEATAVVAAPAPEEKKDEQEEEGEAEVSFVPPPRKWGIALSFGGFGVEEE